MIRKITYNLWKGFIFFIVVLCSLMFIYTDRCKAQIIFSENFESGALPAGWSIGGSGNVLSIFNGASAYGVGNISLKANYFTSTIGTSDTLTTSSFTPTVAGQNIYFNHAHRSYSNPAEQDNLVVLASTDNGINYSQVIQLNADANASYNSLSTVPSNTGLYSPISREWRSKAFSLPAGTNKLKVVFNSGFGNNLFIDNITVGIPDLCSSPASQLSFLAYSNVTNQSICPLTQLTIRLFPFPAPSTNSYQWQSSPNNAVWTDIPGATDSLFRGYQNIQAKFYRCIVSCSGTSIISSSSRVQTNFTDCNYCESSPNYDGDSDIGNITLNTLNNGIATPALNNSTAYNAYSNFTFLPPTELKQGHNYDISISQINEYSFFSANTAVYIDYNKDGVLDPINELVFTGQTNASLGGNVLNGNFFIPSNAQPGYTLMRVVLAEGTNTIPAPCGYFGWGETEDYFVNIIPALCESSAANNIDDDIGNVTFAGINNGSAIPAVNNPTAVNVYTDFSSIVSPATVNQGITYPISISQINSANFYPCFANVFIDYNNDRFFDPFTERVLSKATVSSAVGGNIISDSIQISFSSVTDTVLMRVVLTEIYNGFGTPDDEPCGIYPYGETEDYKIIIRPGTLCTSPPVAGIAISSDTIVCASEEVTLSLSNFDGGNGQTYQWQFSTNRQLWTNLNNNEQDFNYNITQSVTTAFYRCIVTCNNNSDTSSSVKIIINPTDCYCTPNIQYSCNFVYINRFSINTLSNLNTYCNSNQGYTYFTPIGNKTTRLFTGTKYPFSIQTEGDNSSTAAILIDLNNNGSFQDQGEIVYSSPNNSLIGFDSSIIISDNPSFVGERRMRIILKYNASSITTNDICNDFNYGEVEDYIVTITRGANCNSVNYTVLSDVPEACAGEAFNVFLNNADSLSIGSSYQWQTSIDNNNWRNINSANYFTETVTQNQPSYYRCILSCGVQTDTTSSIFIDQRIWSQCYCLSEATDTLGSDIGNVTFSNINNGVAIPIILNSSANKRYTDYTSITATVNQGEAYTFSVAQISAYSYYSYIYLSVFIDFNHNGVFDFSERVFSGNNSNTNIVGGFINIPPDATVGLTRMRFVLTSEFNFFNSCGAYNNGETEDYSININSNLPCTNPPSSGEIKVDTNQVCIFQPFNLYLQNNSSGLGQTYQWQKSNDNLTFYRIQGATASFYNVNSQDTTTYYRCSVTCGNATSTTPSIQIITVPHYTCYCQDNLQVNECGATDNLTMVKIENTTLSNLYTGCTANNDVAYTIYPSSDNTTAQLLKGENYNLTAAASDSSIINAWIDFNQNSIFEKTEFIQISDAAPPLTLVSQSFTVPMTSKLGKTGMRVRQYRYINSFINDSLTSCSPFLTGETEDYIISIQEAIGIKEHLNNDNLAIYPNPSGGKFKLEYSDEPSDYINIIISSSTGSEVYNRKVSDFSGNISMEMDLEHLAKGFYSIRLTTPVKVSVKKLILQ